MGRREIKFRGLTIDNKWVYGSLISNGIYYWIQNDHGGNDAVMVDTIGQFTGLRDKNGEEVYEDDFVYLWVGRNMGKPVKIIIFMGCASLNWTADNGIEYKTAFTAFHDQCMQQIPEFTRTSDIGQFIEVIGNVYEHKHLLET
jgi:uncharacterized phage protein (TIGR01671 family)